jgi:glutamyl-tRNA synthetase
MAGQKVRVRFAPSPTGPLHIGGVRTALYNYLFAKRNGGDFILRIEDTDQNRYVPGAEQYIIDSLNWCGIRFDEDVVKGGPYGPYRQSERKELYRQYAEQLVKSGHAYYAFDTEEGLEKMRDQLKSSHAQQLQYGPTTRLQMKNSLTLSEKETAEILSSGNPFVIRIRIPENEEIRVNDLIRGEVVVHSHNLDDKVLFKSDGWPTYHLANIVDDHLMEITHVIRGEEWLPSAPLHVLLYRYLGWEDTMPEFAHLPLLLKPDGNGKLSKRDGDRLGFPVFPLQWTDPATKEVSSGYRESGYLPEAFVNMLAFLGWNPGTEQEIYSMQDLVEAFSLERVGKHGSKFDHEKAKWFNHQYLQKKTDEELAGLLFPILKEKGLNPEKDYVLKVIGLVRDRFTLIPDLWNQSHYFFLSPETYDPAVAQKSWNPQIAASVLLFIEKINALDILDAATFHDTVKEFTTSQNIKMGQLMNPLRLLVVGSSIGPGMQEIVLLIGKEEFVRRMKTGVRKIDIG